MSGDYTFLASGLLDLFQADGVKWINFGTKLIQQFDIRFWDSRIGE